MVQALMPSGTAIAAGDDEAFLALFSHMASAGRLDELWAEIERRHADPAIADELPSCSRCGSTAVWDDIGPQLCDPCALAALGLADTKPAPRPSACRQCGGSRRIRVPVSRVASVVVVCGECAG